MTQRITTPAAARPLDWPTVEEWIRFATPRDLPRLVRLVGHQTARCGYREHGRELIQVADSLADLEGVFGPLTGPEDVKETP